MVRMTSSRPAFVGRINEFKSSAKPSLMNPDSSTTDCRKALEQVTMQMMELTNNPKALYHQDSSDNPIVTVPDVGSLKLTDEGLQMAILKSTVPFWEQISIGLGALSTKTKYEGMTVDCNKDRTVISSIRGHITESPINDRSAEGWLEKFTLNGSKGAAPVHEVSELGYQFADHVQGVFSKRRGLEIPPHPLFESER